VYTRKSAIPLAELTNHLLFSYGSSLDALSAINIRVGKHLVLASVNIVIPKIIKELITQLLALL
jgi:hypothetical protein